MALRAKFDGGKVINRCQRGSWSTRCFGAALRKNLGASWGPRTYERCTGTDAGFYFWDYSRRILLRRVGTAASKKKPDVRARAHKRKRAWQVQMVSKKARLSYGPESAQVEPDVSPSELEAKSRLTMRLM